MGLGVLRADYEAFGVDFSRRGQLMEELIPFLRRAWTGEPFPYNGTTVRVMPRPVQDPMPIFLGGMTQAATDRAARLADGFHTVVPQTWERYRESCRKFGKADPGPKQDMGGLMYSRRFEDPDGHHWEVVWMDAKAAELDAAAFEEA